MLSRFEDVLGLWAYGGGVGVGLAWAGELAHLPFEPEILNARLGARDFAVSSRPVPLARGCGRE